MVQERRKAGIATLTDELETETAALGAALQEIGAAAEVAIADAALRRAAGTMRARAATILTALALGLAACGGHEKKEAPAPDRTRARRAHTAVAARTGGSGEVAVPASVQARQRASLAARIAASVTELPFQVGQSVAAGAVVVRLDDAALRSALAAAEADLKVVSADLSRTEALLKKGAATRGSSTR